MMSNLLITKWPSVLSQKLSKTSNLGRRERGDRASWENVYLIKHSDSRKSYSVGAAVLHVSLGQDRSNTLGKKHDVCGADSIKLQGV